MIYQVRVLRRAQSDLAEIAAYLRRDSPAAAEQLLEALISRIEGLARHPTRGSVPRDERLNKLGYRFLVESQYLVFYKVFRAQVRVYRVRHGKRAYREVL